MASAESQGKMIAAIVFAILFVAASVVAYVYYGKYDEAEQKFAGANQQAAQANNAANEAKRFYEELRSKTAGKEGDTHETVMGLVNADMASAASKLNEQRRTTKNAYDTYTNAMTYLHAELTASDERIRALEEQNTALESELKATKSKYDIEVAKAQQSQQEKEQELATESNKLLDQNRSLEGRIEELTRRYGQLRDQNEQLRRDLAKLDRDTSQKLAERETIISSLRTEDTLRDQIKFNGKDGSIVQVDSDGRQAYVDIGQEDGVQAGLTFGIYGRDVGGSPYQLPKANLEIVRILGPHRALGRVTGESAATPILPGDLLYNPIWDAGSRESIAYVGLIYLDDDKKDDGDEFRQLVQSMGGKVDAYYDIKNAKDVGKIDVNTGWLVVGEIPEEGDTETLDPEKARLIKELQNAKTKMFTEARNNGVRLINIRNFLTYMGHNRPANRVAAGSEYRHFYGKKRPPLVDKGPASYDEKKK
jgi:hypothetical protein